MGWPDYAFTLYENQMFSVYVKWGKQQHNISTG